MVPRLGIRVRLVGGGVLLTLLISVVAGLIIETQMQRIVRDGTNAVLRADAASYVAAIKNEPGETFDKPGSSQVVGVVNPQEKLVLSTLPDVLNRELGHILHDDSTGDYTSKHGAHYIVRTASVKADDGTWRVITARTADSEGTVLAQMQTLLVVGLGIVVILVAAVAWLLTTASLTPVRQLRRTAERLSTANSRDLLPVPPAQDDITALASTLNGLIEQLRDSADRERQLVSDASHELRTPLAILRAQLDVARAENPSAGPILRDLEAVDASADRLSRLLSSLLELSRIESTAPDTVTTGRQIAKEVTEAAGRNEYRLADDSPISIRADVNVEQSGDTADFAVSRDEVGRVMDNLIGNSLRALGDAAGTVLVGCTISADGVLLTVADDGGGMPEGFDEHALDRFRRADEARADGGAGLGLPIVAAIARRAGGEVELHNRPGAGLTVEIRIPSHSSGETLRRRTT